MIDKTLLKYPLVSICIPTYNSARYLRESLDSIVNQTYTNKEIIVSDNASTDETKKIVEEYVEKYKIKYYRNNRNIGGEANFTRCIELANGEYIAIFHSDDIYKPEMVQKQVNAFQGNLSIAAVFTMANHINNFGKIVGEDKLPAELKYKNYFYFPEIFFSIMRNDNFLLCPSAMVKGEIYKKLAPFNEDKFKTSADLDMWLRILKKYPIAILNEKLMNRRINNTQGSYTTTYLRTEQLDFFKVMDHYLLHKSIVPEVSYKTLNKYEFLKYIDKVKRVINYLIKKQPQEAKDLLDKSFSLNIFFEAIANFKKPKYFIWWCIGIIISGLVHLGLGQYLGKSLHWILYTFKRRFI